MFGSSLDRMLTHFTDQFEATDGGYLYRKSMRGAPIRVSAAERDAMVAAFKRSLPLLLWGWVAALLLLILGFVVFAAASDAGPESLTTWLIPAIVPLALAYWVCCMHVWNAPARQLGRRTPIGPERTRAEVRRHVLARMSWGELLIAVALLGVFLLNLVSRENILEGWHRLWLLVFAAAAVGILVRIWQKWRLDSDGSSGA